MYTTFITQRYDAPDKNSHRRVYFVNLWIRMSVCGHGPWLLDTAVADLSMYVEIVTDIGGIHSI